MPHPHAGRGFSGPASAEEDASFKGEPLLLLFFSAVDSAGGAPTSDGESILLALGSHPCKRDEYHDAYTLTVSNDEPNTTSAKGTPQKAALDRYPSVLYTLILWVRCTSLATSKFVPRVISFISCALDIRRKKQNVLFECAHILL